MDLIRISTAMKILEKILDNLSQLQDKDLDNLLKLIRSAFKRYTLPNEMIEAGKAPEEMKEIIKSITPEWICDAIAQDELGAWCQATQRDIVLALAGQKMSE